MAILTISETDRLLKDGNGEAAPIMGQRIAGAGYDPASVQEHTFTATKFGFFRIATDTAIHVNWSGDGAAADTDDDYLPAGGVEVFPVLGVKVTWAVAA